MILAQLSPLTFQIWLIPAAAAALASYLVLFLWTRRHNDPGHLPAALSFLMGAICAYYRYERFGRTVLNNTVVMFLVGASTNA